MTDAPQASPAQCVRVCKYAEELGKPGYVCDKRCMYALAWEKTPAGQLWRGPIKLVKTS